MRGTAPSAAGTPAQGWRWPQRPQPPPRRRPAPQQTRQTAGSAAPLARPLQPRLWLLLLPTKQVAVPELCRCRCCCCQSCSHRASHPVGAALLAHVCEAGWLLRDAVPHTTVGMWAADHAGQEPLTRVGATVVKAKAAAGHALHACGCSEGHHARVQREPPRCVARAPPPPTCMTRHAAPRSSASSSSSCRLNSAVTTRQCQGTMLNLLSSSTWRSPMLATQRACSYGRNGLTHCFLAPARCLGRHGFTVVRL